jgi:hypothetical protein
MDHKQQKKLCILGAFALLMLLVSACAAPTPEVQIKEVTVIVEPTPVPPEPTEEPADQSAYHVDWESGPHSTYDEGHGPNDWCARCHSPQNWNPEATIGRPPNCVSCKFPGQEMTVGDGNVFIEEADWKAIPCETCHVMVGDYATEIAWLNPISMDYEEVSDPTELCEKCHVTTTGNSFGSAVTHKITLGGSAHLNYGGYLGDSPPPTYCTDCHDPHTAEPLQCIDCHAEDVKKDTHAGGMFNTMSESVTCMACHDAAGFDVGPHPSDESGLFVTQETTMGRGGPSTSAVISHSIVYEVACDKCHYEGNSWELIVLNADGSVPEPEE